MSESHEEGSYFNKRLAHMGITSADQYTVKNYVYGRFNRGEEGFVEQQFEIFTEDKEGNVRITYPTLDGLKMQWRSGDSRFAKDFAITRLQVPRDGRKYNMPKGAGSEPFLPPALIAKYQAKTEIPTLVLTEGAFKAFAGSLKGIDIAALTSITHFKNKDTGMLHPDLLDVIKVCKVRRVLWLVDGDCNNLSSKFGTKDGADVDLYRRPHQFFSSASTLKMLLDDHGDIEKWFAHPLSDEIDGNPKGLDDLLAALPDNVEEIKKDLLSFSKKGQGKYFHKLNITYSVNDIRKYLHLHDVNDFYHHHAAKYKTLADADFVWNGTRYRYNQEKNECQVMVPGNAKDYFRVGDQYHEFVDIPNKYHQLERVFHRRMKATIIEDHGKGLITHVPKYKAFCNVPDHTNFQQVIHNCFNVYSPMEHTPEEGPIDATMEFLRHIFGTGTIKWTDPDTKEKLEVNELDLGLDYIQLLYTRPTQILPILCLVSRENNTGKSTLAKWLKLLFTANVAIVGNAELSNDFNAGWATKLLIICDETKIDKQVVVERVKNLSTADKIFMNAKGKDHVELDFFGKFIFLTNNEDNFIYASEDDVRYWVRKVPPTKKLNVRMLLDMQDEIPAFLNFLQKRSLTVPQRHRAWFDPALTKTEALQKVIKYSASALEKELRSYLRDAFMDFGQDEIYMTITSIKEEWFKTKYEKHYIETVVKEKLKGESYHELWYDGKQFKTLQEVRNYVGEKNWTTEVVATIEKVPKVIRHTYAKWDRVENEMQRVEKKCNGRPFVFRVEDFLSAEEIRTRTVDPEMRIANDLNSLKTEQLSLTGLNSGALPEDTEPFTPAPY